jgi:hypothetical protein
MEQQALAHKFASHAEFEAHLKGVIAQSVATLQMFDPDFAVFPLGSSEVDALLRLFLARGGVLRLAAHRCSYIEQHYPRFLTLLKDYSHRVECRVTNRALHHLTDSFCIGDTGHIVRRFHCDHLRGEACFDQPKAVEISQERFTGMWAESAPGLHAGTTGL